MRSDDTDLGAVLAAVRSGDPEAFRAVVARHGRGIVAFCARAGGDPALGEDLAQEVFVRAWSRIATYRPEHAFSTWLYRIALNLCRDHRRRARVRPRVASIEPVPPPADEQPGPLELAERTEQATLAAEALERLDEREREIVVLHAMSGLGLREIARTLELPPSTVKNRFAAGLGRLRRWLGGAGTGAVRGRIESSKELS